MRALRIDPDTTVTGLALPPADAHSVIRELVGSPDAVDQATYHQRAVMHIHGTGRQDGLPQNLAAWALASAWRRTALYPLAGPIVVTGRTTTGDLSALDDYLVQHTQAVAQTVRDALAEWRDRPPASNEAAIRELLAYAARDIASRR
ncbi:hypothetical protein AB0E08_41935 [Streptomyces sp. NPDC048281]|uniref:hypothetical protein n=1 Tax=Streptomyces sp. NPDC048281 TaxID=3154715 RepID=UPI003438D009